MRAAGVAALAGLLGYYWAASLASNALEPSLAKEDEGKDVVVVGTIDNLPYVFDGGMRFNFAVERTEAVAGRARAGAVPPRIAVSWYANLRGAPVAVPEVQPGERWRLKVRLQRPHGNANPYACAS